MENITTEGTGEEEEERKKEGRKEGEKKDSIIVDRIRIDVYVYIHIERIHLTTTKHPNRVMTE